MRTIDPFLSPGLWGGPPKPPQSLMTAAGRFSSPPWRPAAVSPLRLHQGPLASLSGSVLGPHFHAWYGQSGRRTICSVYPVLEAIESRGLPDFIAAVVVGAVRQENRLYACAIFAFNEHENKRPYVEDAIAAGATEWHVHLLAQDETQRAAVLRDLEST